MSKPNEEQIGFLLADVARLMRRAFQQRLVGVSQLTHAQARVLVYLARSEGMRQVELAEQLEVKPMTLARLIDQLAASGLVERRSDPADRRAYQLFLTDLALPQLDFIAATGSSIRDCVTRSMDPAAMAVTLKTLDAMRQKLIEVTKPCVEECEP